MPVKAILLPIVTIEKKKPSNWIRTRGKWKIGLLTTAAIVCRLNETMNYILCEGLPNKESVKSGQVPSGTDFLPAWLIIGCKCIRNVITFRSVIFEMYDFNYFEFIPELIAVEEREENEKKSCVPNSGQRVYIYNKS